MGSGVLLEEVVVVGAVVDEDVVALDVLLLEFVDVLLDVGTELVEVGHFEGVDVLDQRLHHLRLLRFRHWLCLLLPAAPVHCPRTLKL